jgi:hypothetical protein
MHNSGYTVMKHKIIKEPQILIPQNAMHFTHIHHNIQPTVKIRFRQLNFKRNLTLTSHTCWVWHIYSSFCRVLTCPKHNIKMHTLWTN